MKIIHIIAKVVLSMCMLLPSLGLFRIFPAPTRDLYNSDAAFAFIQMIMNAALYIDVMMVGVLLVSVILLWTKREAPAALLITPITANVVGFHLFLDGGLINAGAIPALVMLVLNGYFLYKNRRLMCQLCASQA